MSVEIARWRVKALATAGQVGRMIGDESRFSAVQSSNERVAGRLFRWQLSWGQLIHV